MRELYGEKESALVFEMLENLDPELNKIVQNIAYGYFWARGGLTICEKSLITVSSLLAMRKERQTRPHMIGFLNTGGSSEEIIAVLVELSRIIGADIGENGLLVLCDVLEANGTPIDAIQNIKNLFIQYTNNADSLIKLASERTLQLAKVSGFVAIGEFEKTKEAMKGRNCSDSDLRNLLIHQIVYCGFPAAINGFFALKSVHA